jgi:hypothetical protein
MEPETEPTAELMPTNPIRVETALSRYPMHRLARKGSIEICIRECDRAGVETQWEVDFSHKHGQPGPLAYKIDTLVINRRIEEASRPIPRVLRLGSLKEICRELGMAETGGNTNQIKKALYQNAFAGITAKTRFRLANGIEQTLESGFTRYSVIFTGEKLPDGRKADGVYIILNDVFIRVINGAMTRPLDYDYLKSLSPAPQRFYELLSYQIYGALKYDRPRAKLLYSELCAHAPQTRHLDWGAVRSQMHKVHRPHRESGYIHKVDFQQTTDATGQPDWIMLYMPGPKARAEFRTFTKRGGPTVLEIEALEPQVTPPTPELSELGRELVQRGVTQKTAIALMRNHQEEKIRAHIEQLEWMMEKKSKKVVDPAAYLVKSIQDDYAAPKGFISKAERERREEAKRAQEREAAEAKRQEREARAREHAALERINVYWESLTPQEQAKLQTEADGRVSPEELASEIKPFKSTSQRLRREEFIRELLVSSGQLVHDK